MLCGPIWEFHVEVAIGSCKLIGSGIVFEQERRSLSLRSVVFIVFLFEPDRRSYEIIKYGLINEMLHDCAAF